MKILHVIHSDLKFAEGAARFIDKCNIKRQHYILYVNTENTYTLVLNDIETAQREIILKKGNEWRKLICIVRFCDRFDYVIFHSLFLYSQLKIMIALKGSLVKKAVWVGFGGDLYITGGLRARAAAIPNRLIAKKCYGYVGIFPPDCKEFKRHFPRAKAKVYYAPYVGGKMPEEYDHYSFKSNFQDTIEKSRTLTFLIGNCADASMGHEEILKMLGRFSKEDIKLIIPLSYGNNKYGDEIEKLAKEIFQDKAVCLREFIEEDKYFEYLRTVDIGIFNVKRQQALGNIHRLIFRNVKIFLPEESVMYDYFISKGVPISKVSDLKRISFDELKSMPVFVEKNKFHKYISTFYNMDYYLYRWRCVYKDLEESLEKWETKQ